jgi:lipoprotein-anchoring transpeptidase ErfK/SrfK
LGDTVQVTNIIRTLKRGLGSGSSTILSKRMARRSVLGFAALSLAGCVTDNGSLSALASLDTPEKQKRRTPSMYREMVDGGFRIPEVDPDEVDARFWRTEVAYETSAAPGTLVVDTPNRYLYHVGTGGRSIRYGVGVGREGFEWSGQAVVAWQKAWPRWVPPDSMIARQPELKKYTASAGGMQPGLRNPLGARALYIHDHGKDTLYRLHGNNEPSTIGKAVSSGCIRLLNQDIIHLAANVPNGSAVIVIPDPAISSIAVDRSSRS